MSRLARYQRLLCGIAVVLLIGAVGVLVSLQGWKSRLVNVDLVPHIDSAYAFVAHGQLPERGCLNTFASFIPPGTTWLLLPGLFVFKDPRLFEALGSVLLFVGTLLGMLVLAHPYWGHRCALLAVGLYGVSELGVYYAGSLWPRGHPFFYVWMVYWTGRWVQRQQAKYLPAALVTWAAGMYVFLELAPAGLILPVMWLLYRPPIRLWALGVGVGASLLIWYPYLVFEAKRDFVDLRSQVLQQQMLPANFQPSWCDPGLTKLREWEETPAPPDDQEPHPYEAWRHVVVRGKAVVGGFLYNFTHTAPIPGASLMLMLAVSSMVMVSLLPLSAPTPRRAWPPWLMPLAFGLMLCGVLVDGLGYTRLLRVDDVLQPSTFETLRVWQVILGLSGLVLFIYGRHGPSKQHPLRRQARMSTGRELLAQPTTVLVLSLLIPWSILLWLAEPNMFPLGGERRFWWLWPLEMVILAAFMTHLLPRWRVPRPLVRCAHIGLILLIVVNPLALERLAAWQRTGWTGPDAAEAQAVDYVAAQLRAQGKRQAAIGYQTLYLDLPAFNFFMADFHEIDARYKVGADFDLLFTFRHGITNTNQCAEGFSPDDDYRIVQHDPLWALPKYNALGLERRFQFLQQFGAYDVFKRH